MHTIINFVIATSKVHLKIIKIFTKREKERERTAIYNNLLQSLYNNKLYDEQSACSSLELEIVKIHIKILLSIKKICFDNIILYFIVLNISQSIFIYYRLFIRRFRHSFNILYIVISLHASV